MNLPDRDADPLAEFIPTPDVRERFEVRVAATPATTMAVARAFDMQSIWLVRMIFRAREVIKGSSAGARTPQGLMKEMRGLGWGVLRDDPGLIVAGAICQPWLADVRFRPTPEGQFATYTEPNHVKIAWTIEVIPDGVHGCRLASETRVVATDEEARARFRRYWRWARFGIITIRWLLLPAVARRARKV